MRIVTGIANESNHRQHRYLGIVLFNKYYKEIDASIQRAESFMGSESPNGANYGREMALVRTKLQEAKMWAGKVLEAVGNPFPPELADKADTVR